MTDGADAVGIGRRPEADGRSAAGAARGVANGKEIGSPIEMSSGLKAGAAVSAGADAGSGRAVSAPGADSTGPATVPMQRIAAMITTTESCPTPPHALPATCGRFEIWRRGIERILMRAGKCGACREQNKTENTIASGA